MNTVFKYIVGKFKIVPRKPLKTVDSHMSKMAAEYLEAQLLKAKAERQEIQTRYELESMLK